MYAAGKRETRPPDRLINSLFQQDQVKMGPITNTTTSDLTPTTPTTSTTMVSSMSVATTSVAQSKLSVTEQSKSESSVQSILHQMMAKINANHTRTEEQFEALHRRTEEGINQCIQRYQLTDTRLTRVEDENAVIKTQVGQQTTNNQVTEDRLNTLETQIVQMRTEISQISDKHRISTNHDLSQILKPSVLSSTAVQPNLSGRSNVSPMPLTASTTNLVNTFDSRSSSFLGAQERFQDSVSEFSGQIKEIHPQKFIGQVDAYFDSVHVSPAQQLISTHRRLVGDAQIWYESLIPSPRSYAEFRLLFLQHFWSPATQRKARNEIFRHYQYTRSDGLATHAMKWIAGAKYLNPPIEQSDLVSTIIQHYPTSLGMAIRGRGPRDTNELLSVLMEFEESASFCERRREDNQVRPPFQHQNNGNQQPRYNAPRRDNYRFQPRVVTPDNAGPRPVAQVDLSGNDDEART